MLNNNDRFNLSSAKCSRVDKYERSSILTQRKFDSRLNDIYITVLETSYTHFLQPGFTLNFFLKEIVVLLIIRVNSQKQFHSMFSREVHKILLS